ncbi:MFS family permease [Variovorax boronicumulans]|uniref:MFS transporter n=1 Tax=Variovorax boronicumulans TaxID=436515 RepID=UPI0027850387|nr:MFS transporter [Variovorax boronicumulans]MDP9991303.1 MFS family permease [Variovorax boronicumulans]MDQ0003333.1 MFS family permease [Variovorax boronicumulans]
MNDSVALSYTLLRGFRSSVFHAGLAIAFYSSLGFSFCEITTLSSAYWITFSILQLPCGILADRIGPQLALFAGGMTISLSYFIEAISANYSLFFFAAVLCGFGQSLSSGSDSALLRKYLQTLTLLPRFSHYESLGWSARHVGIFASLLAGSLIAFAFDLRLAFLLSAACALVAALLPFSLSKESPAFDGHTIEKASRDPSSIAKKSANNIMVIGIAAKYVVLYSIDALLIVLFQITMLSLGIEPFVSNFLFAMVLAVAVISYKMREVFSRLTYANAFVLFSTLNCIGFLIAFTGIQMTKGGLVLILAGFSICGVVKGIYSPIYVNALFMRVNAKKSATAISAMYLFGGLTSSMAISGIGRAVDAGYLEQIFLLLSLMCGIVAAISRLVPRAIASSP